ncbi:MAG: mechanosensitive ion channel family protein [Akkermansia sp.]|nr:mechanosensitive ion channel family protein [Akkermansia sp.]
MEETLVTDFPTLGELWQLGWFRCSITLAVGILLSIATKRIFRPLNKRLPHQVGMLIEKAILALLWMFIIVHALRAVGVDLISVLGAAGVAGIAIGFAAQTVLSNLISGIFIMSERSIRLGDYVTAGGMSGTVESVNLLSVTLRQSDNSTVRIPCETLVKSPVVNMTGDSLRRCDFDLGVDYTCDLEHVRQVILKITEEQPLLASDPAPAVHFTGFGDSSLNLHIGAWCKTEDYHQARFAFGKAILDAFARENINIPFPIRTVIHNGN